MESAMDEMASDGNLNPTVQPLLTDMYQISMAYAYWHAGKHEDSAVFDLFFRKNPFQGEFTIFAGLNDCVEFIRKFRFRQSDISYLKSIMPPTTEEEFFDYLSNLDCSNISVWAVKEGTVAFPRVPLLIVEGPLAVCQLLETTLLNLVNYASLVCTNAARYRLAVGEKTSLLEFGLRRAQGPDGAMSASKYTYIGGFDGTSNVLAGKIYGIPVRGTQAHAFVSAFESSESLQDKPRLLQARDGSKAPSDLLQLAMKYMDELAVVFPSISLAEINQGELRAFVAYASAFPKGFLALIDTYDVLHGAMNFCSVALALNQLGFRALGVRIDSGDLAYLSRQVHAMFTKIANHLSLPWFTELSIVASNDINEETIYSLKEQRHQITTFGVGTHLVTCQKQPALGCVYKLVQLNDSPRIKLSEDIEKISIPGSKRAYRLYGKGGYAINDLMILHDEDPPTAGEAVLCRHPFQGSLRAKVTPAIVEPLHLLYWSKGQLMVPHLPNVKELKNTVNMSLSTIREDHKRRLNPTPYKVSVSKDLYEYFHQLWLSNAPIKELM